MTGRALLPLGLVLLALVLAPRAAAAQVAGRATGETKEDPFAEVLFAPELIMRHGRAVGLTDEQRAVITRLIEQAQSRVVGLQWQLVEQVQALKETLAGARVDQDRAADQLNRVLDTEKRIKQAHLEMLIRIKNVLRPEQQAELTRLRDADSGKLEEPQGEA